MEIRDLTLSGDQAGGLELNRTTDSKVRDVTATDEPNGVFLHVNSANVLLDAMTITGGRTGIVAEKTTKSLHVTGSTIDSARVAGIAIGGNGTQIDGLTVKDSRTGVRVERGAGDVTANNVTLIGGDDGLVTSGGTTGIVVKNLTTDGVDNALRNLSSGMQITGGHHPRWPHRHGPAGGHDRQRHPGRADHHGHPRPRGRADRARRRDRRRGVGRRRVPAGNRGHAARLLGARAGGRPRPGDAARATPTSACRR